MESFYFDFTLVVFSFFLILEPYTYIILVYHGKIENYFVQLYIFDGYIFNLILVCYAVR